MISESLLKLICNDPVYNCEVYKNEGCSHVDGFLCDFEKCDIRLGRLREKNLVSSEGAPENKF